MGAIWRPDLRPFHWEMPQLECPNSQEHKPEPSPRHGPDHAGPTHFPAVNCTLQWNSRGATQIPPSDETGGQIIRCLSISKRRQHHYHRGLHFQGFQAAILASVPPGVSRTRRRTMKMQIFFIAAPSAMFFNKPNEWNRHEKAKIQKYRATDLYVTTSGESKERWREKSRKWTASEPDLQPLTTGQVTNWPTDWLPLPNDSSTSSSS